MEEALAVCLGLMKVHLLWLTNLYPCQLLRLQSCLQVAPGSAEKTLLHLLFSKCFQLKITSTPKWHILGFYMLDHIGFLHYC